MNETFGVNVGERVHHGTQDRARFRGCERPARNYRGQIFFRILHHHEEHSRTIELAASHIQQPNHVRMRKFPGVPPTRQ